STLIVDHNYTTKICVATERKSTKYKSKVIISTTSTPPKNNRKEGDKRNINDGKLQKIQKTLLSQDGEPCDNDFYVNCHLGDFVGYEEEGHNDFILNFHPPSNIGYEASDTGFAIPEVVTPTRMKLALYLVQSSNNILLNEVVSNFAKYWDIQEKRRKALVK
ncbi:hypothetical protein RYX36_004338, partial [Vicia faba]